MKNLLITFCFEKILKKRAILLKIIFLCILRYKDIRNYDFPKLKVNFLLIK